MTSGFLERTITHEGREVRFVVYVPRKTTRPLPAILFLHGRGECGVDGLLQVSVGLPIAIMKKRESWPFLVVIPQKATQDSTWWDEKENLQLILASVEKEFQPDAHRRYLTGLSQGGHGTFRLAKHLPWQFAAIAPVCGWVDPALAAKELRDTPVWAFHGEKDTVVKPEGSINAVEAILAAGGKPTLTLYPDLTHNSWDAAYQTSDLPNWLLSHTLE